MDMKKIMKKYDPDANEQANFDKYKHDMNYDIDEKYAHEKYEPAESELDETQ